MFKIKLLSPDSIGPQKAFSGDAGFDVYNHSKTVRLGFGDRFKFQLGFALELPPGWFALIQERSGMAIDSGILTIGNVIDSTYRGEIHAILCCFGHRLIEIQEGQRIAQMIVIRCYTEPDYMITSELSLSFRGRSGFGSTGSEVPRVG